MNDELDRQRTINVKLRRQLEKCRQDTVEYCAKFCDDHYVSMRSVLREMPSGRTDWHYGRLYSEKLRMIIKTKSTETMEGKKMSEHNALPILEVEDVAAAIREGVEDSIPSISVEMVIEAIAEGVRLAMWKMITNATDAPCGDFYEAVTNGVEKGMVRIKSDG